MQPARTKGRKAKDTRPKENRANSLYILLLPADQRKDGDTKCQQPHDDTRDRHTEC